MESHPERGPWNRRKVDVRKGFYPYRIEIDPIEAYSRPLNLSMLEKNGLALKEQTIRRGSSVVYLDDIAFHKLVKLIEVVNQNSLRLDLFSKRRLVVSDSERNRARFEMSHS